MAKNDKIAGNVPNKGKSNIPRLRFPEFEGEWKENKLEEIGEFLGGGTPSSSNADYWDGKIPWISSSDLKENDINTINISRYISKEAVSNSATKLCKAPAIHIVSRVGVGKVAYSSTSLCTSQDFVNIINFKCNGLFLSYLLSIRMREAGAKTQGTSIKGISSIEIKTKNILLPLRDEQNKISQLLSLIDHRIQTQNKIILHYQSLIQNLGNAIFKQKIRFKDNLGNDFPNWERCNLKDVAERVVEKNFHNNQNILTISAQYGLISQLDFFNKSVAAKNVSGYYLLTRGDFAYNKSYSAGYPMGAIKRLNRYNQGIVSTLYICFRFKERANQDFMEHYFESQIQNSELEKIAQEGARNHGLLNVGVNDFFNVEIKLPSINEQVEIAKLLSSLGMRITVEKNIFGKLKQQKDYLLQNLFI